MGEKSTGIDDASMKGSGCGDDLDDITWAVIWLIVIAVGTLGGLGGGVYAVLS